MIGNGKDDERWNEDNNDATKIFLSRSHSLSLSTTRDFPPTPIKDGPFSFPGKMARPSVTHRYAYAHTHFLFTPLPGPHRPGLNPARRSVFFNRINRADSSTRLDIGISPRGEILPLAEKERKEERERKKRGKKSCKREEGKEEKARREKTREDFIGR